MTWTQILGVALTFAFEIFKLWKEENAYEKARKADALHDAIQAIHDNDASALTESLDRMRL